MTSSDPTEAVTQTMESMAFWRYVEYRDIDIHFLKLRDWPFVYFDRSESASFHPNFLYMLREHAVMAEPH
jgi:hypothetical protein